MIIGGDNLKFFKDFSLRKLLFNKKFAIGLSLFVAFFFWLIIAIDQSPERERTINKIQIEVDTSSIWGNESLKVVGDITTTASVTVYGPNYIVSSLTADDISVSADLSNVKGANTYELSLVPSRKNNDSAYNFVSISPATITVELDHYETKTVEAVPIIEGYDRIDRDDYLYEPIFTDGNLSVLSVDIKGFRQDLEKLSKIEVRASTDELLTESKVFSEPEVIFLDKEGNILEKDKYTLPYDSIPIAMMVSKEKTLSVAPAYTNMWNPQIASVLNSCWSTDTKSLTIKGPPTVIDSISTIEYVNPIDLSQLSSSDSQKTFELTPKLQEGITISDAVDKVVFKYNMSRFSVKNFYITNFAHDGTLKPGLSVSYDKRYSVTVCGLKNTINSLSSSDLYLSLDLSDMTDNNIGTNAVAATLKSNKNISVWMVGSCDVTIKLSK